MRFARPGSPTSQSAHPVGARHLGPWSFAPASGSATSQSRSTRTPGGAVRGELEEAGPGLPHDPHGAVAVLPPGAEEPVTVPCEEIVGFVLLPDAPLDRSDELGSPG